MKKILILSVILVSLFSCSDDDETNLDPIIGTWKLEKQQIEDFDGTIVDETNECTIQSTLIFKSDNTSSVQLFGGPDQDGNCASDPVSKADWVNKGGNKYEILEEGETTPDVLEINFEENNTKFTIGSITWRKQ